MKHLLSIVDSVGSMMDCFYCAPQTPYRKDSRENHDIDIHTNNDHASETLSAISDLLYLFDIAIDGTRKHSFHRCWSVGNNVNGQQANVYSEWDYNQRLQIMNKLPNSIRINDIITGCLGSTYILYNTPRQMEEEDIMVFGCNASGQLSIDAQVIRSIIKYWTRHMLVITQDITKLIEAKTRQMCFNLGSVLTPLNVEQFNTIQHKISFVSQGIGGHHKFIVTQDKWTGRDHLFGCGRNDHNQLGAADRLNRDQFTEIKYFMNISVELAQIHCARDLTHFLTEKGAVFEASERSYAIRPIKIAATIVDLCCGYEHTLAIDQNGRVYSWGDNLYGQLGHGRYKSKIKEPKMIRWLHRNRVNALEISAGQYHSAMLSTTGHIYMFGWNEFYQCGDESDDEKICSPALNRHIDRAVKDIKCGFNHNVAVTQDNEYYFWGHNRYNQCMVYDDNQTYVKKPTKWDYVNDIGKFRKILAVYPGWCSTIVVTT